MALGSALLVVVVLIPTMAYARQDELAGVRQVTAQFHRVDAAKEAGYELGYVNGLGNRIITGCIAHPTAGAMGYHYFNKALIDDMVVDPLKPEGLVYAPAANGELKLVSVEYVVPGPGSNPPGPVRAAADRVRTGDGDSRPGCGLLHVACLGLGPQPGRHVRALESRGHLSVAVAARRRVGARLRLFFLG